MLNEKVVKLLQSQVNKEYASAYLYLDFAGYYQDKGLAGFATWFDVQAKEEVEHAQKFVSYLQANGIRPEYKNIDLVKSDLKDLGTALTLALDHERFVTASINEIYAAADKVKDYRTMEFLNWFVKEQLEEEENAQGLIDQFAMVKDNAAALYMLDRKLGKRD